MMVRITNPRYRGYSEKRTYIYFPDVGGLYQCTKGQARIEVKGGLHQMRNLIIISILTSTFFGCNHPKDSVVISPALSRNLKLIIEKQDSLIESNPALFDGHIYKIRFEKNQNKCYVIIGTDIYYNSRLMDGYLLYNKNLIVFEKSINNQCNNQVKIEDQIINSKELSIYSDEKESLTPYRSNWWMFKIDGDSLIVYDQGRLKINFNPR